MNNKMWDYIDEQVDVLTNILTQEEKITSFLPESFINVNKIIITASGSSYNAALLAKTILEKKTTKQILVETPFHFRYYFNLSNQNENNLLIALSQTGKSIGTLECITLAKAKQIPTLALTSDNQSPIAKKADFHINILCGKESVGPKTKGFSATVLVLQLVLMKLLKLNNHDFINEYKQSISDLPINIQEAKKWCYHNQSWSKAQAMSITGFGINYQTSREGTLKILETMQIPVMNFELEEFMHGPHRTIINDSYLILINTPATGNKLMDNLITFAKSKTKNYLVLSTKKQDDGNVISINDYPLTDSWLNILVIFQVICTYLPEINGIDSSKPVYQDFATTAGTRIP